jgi:hypothetical protein
VSKLKISSYAVKTAAFSERFSLSKITIGQARKGAAPNAGADALKNDSEENPVKLSLSRAAGNYLAKLREQRAQSETRLKAALEEINFSPRRAAPKSSNWEDLRTEVLEKMLYLLTGKHYKAQKLSMEDARAQTSSPSINISPLEEQILSGAAAQETTITSYTHEYEYMSFSASGIVNTADGKTITLDINLNMSREFESYSQVAFTEMKRTTDPLIINYGGGAASLSAEKMSFDLDMDGIKDNISFAGNGSGFLALDKNGDGKINDGGELFGPQSGSGFRDLRAYDKDGNGWIDENDDVFAKLKVWARDENGNDILYSLSELDVGAIYLGETASEFSLKDNEGKTHGQIRSSGFYLKESGGAGILQHVDLTL